MKAKGQRRAKVLKARAKHRAEKRARMQKAGTRSAYAEKLKRQERDPELAASGMKPSERRRAGIIAPRRHTQ